MSDTSLNAVAIAIFTVVMLSLLGPLVQLSPFVPAVLTFAVLGLATVDNLSWQGRGGSLLTDWFANFSAEHRQRVVRHEAGHFLAAHLLNIPVTDYTLSAWEAFRQGQPGLGGVCFDCQELDAELAQGTLSAQLLDRYCTVWMAGATAEKLVYGDSQGGADDRQKFRTIWSGLRRPPAEGEQKERWAVLRSRTLLQDHWAAYEALVNAMEQRSSVDECRQAIVQHLPETQNV